MTIPYADFEKVEVRVGRVERAESFPEARTPALRLWIDFGSGIGVKKTTARLTRHYTPDQLVGTQDDAVTNFAPKLIGPFMSEVLVLGVPDEDGEVVLLRPDRDVPPGGRMF